MHFDSHCCRRSRSRVWHRDQPIRSRPYGGTHPDCGGQLAGDGVGDAGVLYREFGAYPWDDALRRARAAMPAGTVKAIL